MPGAGPRENLHRGRRRLSTRSVAGRMACTKALISTDARYYRWQRDFLKPGDRPLTVQSQDRTTAAPMIAGSAPITSSIPASPSSRSTTSAISPARSASPIPRRSARSTCRSRPSSACWTRSSRSEGEPDLVQISGGEPTMHPQIRRRPDARQVEADPSRDAQHQRHAHRAGPGFRRRAGASSRPASKSICNSIR